MNNWLCLKTSSGKEIKLGEQLTGLGLTVYVPQYEKVVRNKHHRFNEEKDKYETVEIVRVMPRPFFPTYLFTTPDYHNRKSAVQLLPVSLKSWVVGELDEYFIDELKSRQRGKYIVLSKDEKRVTAHRPYKKGDTVIYSGIGHFEAIFDSYTSDDQRVVILATMFNQTKRMPVSINELALAV